MLNIIKKSIVFLVAQATKVIAGMTQHAEALSLPHSVEQDLPAKLEALNTANAAHKAAVVVMKNKRVLLDNAVKPARRFLMLVRENLKPTLGPKYSEQWSAAGFDGKLAVPTSADALLNGLLVTKSYLTAHPIPDGGPNLAAERAGQLHAELAAAITAVVQQTQVVNQALNTRNQKAAALEKGLRTVLSELHQVLTPLDADWLSFGFKKPGARATPDVPQNLTAVLIGTNAIAMKWESAARASYYRVYKRVVGQDADFVPVDNPADLDFTIVGLPGNSTVEVAVTALNNGGESQKSIVVTVNTL